MFNEEITKDKSLYPLTEPGQDGKQRKMSIKPADFGDDCETINFQYVAGKGIYLTYAANLAIFRQIMTALEDSLRKREPSHLTFEQKFKNKPSSYITVGRRDDGLPFIRIKATPKEGGERHKDFSWYLPYNVEILRDGAPVSDLEKAERSARAFLLNASVFVKWLESKYKARVWQQAGSYNGGGGQQGGQQGGGYNGGGGGNSNPPKADKGFDEYF